MIGEEFLEGRGIRDASVLAAMRRVPREDFVPPELRDEAFADKPLAIGFGATISQPYIVAAMTELLELRGSERVLEIGTGSGYQAAILTLLAAEVFSIEIVPELARHAAGRLRRFGAPNIHVRQGDGYKGWPEEAPFDRVLLTAAPPELPAPLVRQVRKGGRLVAPVGKGEAQSLLVIDVDSSGRTRTREVFPVVFVPMVPGR